ncbi:TonB C-terminal domain-containing protein [Gemmatimonas sp.]|uniref:TonB C-terminal domain-containing protein n=1 Tax=Gemmatimonas sp. TaxID=1962908 RepID=UPI0033407530
MTARPRRSSKSTLGSGMIVSALVHAVLIALVVWAGGQQEPPRPPVYRVELVGQAGLRQAGVEKATETPTASKDAVAGAERVEEEKTMPSASKAKKALPSPKATPSTDRSKKGGAKSATPSTTKTTAAPRSGAGATGTKGADVANVRTDGIAFPYPGYLSNIVRQIALNWSPRKVSAALVTELKFMIRRDGTVVGIEVVKRSGDRLYDLDAMGAIEAVGSTRSFGALPSGWADDVLVVYFTFDYALRPQ